MNDRFKFRYFYNNTIYDVFAVDFMNKTAQLVSLDRTETLFKGIDTDKLIQCTGLKDKNKRLIYEGDILKINTHFNHLVSDDFNYKYENEKGYSLFKVIYKDEFARFEVERIKWVKFETEHTRLGYIPKNHSIIGNIYENAELLEE